MSVPLCMRVVLIDGLFKLDLKHWEAFPQTIIHHHVPLQPGLCLVHLDTNMQLRSESRLHLDSKVSTD